MTERRSNGSREDSFKRMFRWFMVAVLVVIEIALLWKMIISDSPTTALLLAIVLIVALLFLIGAQSFGIVGLSIGTGGLRAQIQDVEQKVDEVGGKVDVANNRINELFLDTLSDEAYLHLRKLAEPEGYGKYEMSPGLYRELPHLVNVGYIEVPSFDDIPREDENLSDYVTITDAGREFVKLREERKGSTT